ncbi:cell wall hydrolase [Paenibacillus sp. KS-LC4]|uniref:cell wall hydrolase n=1 Tax=Paenibacillus sp. KS-LC4 TaxID=2979727 RepID=UPI0030D348D3
MIRESRPVKRLIFAMVLGMLLLCIGPLASASAADDAKIKLDGKQVVLNDSTFILDGRLYVPVARIAELFNARSSWDSDNEEVTIHTAVNDKIVLGNGVPVVYFNDERYVMDAAPVFKEGRLYASLRQLAEMLHADLQVNAESGDIELATVKPAVITDKYGIDEISKETKSSKSELLKRNGLDSKAKLKAGMKLKVIIPSVFDHAAEPFTEADLTLLAKITMVESGYESYQGQLALANVILNRVKDSRFPNSIREVIYSGRQFPPAHNGLLDKSKPNEGSLRAAKEALNGKNNVQNAIYFFNPNVSQGAFWDSLEVITTIGNHSFAK